MSAQTHKNTRAATLLNFQWVNEFGIATVVESTGRSPDIIHAPDPNDSTPGPACRDNGLRPDAEWRTVELCGGLAAFRSPCQNEQCREQLEEIAADIGVDLDA